MLKAIFFQKYSLQKSDSEILHNSLSFSKIIFVEVELLMVKKLKEKTRNFFSHPFLRKKPRMFQKSEYEPLR